MPRIEYDECWCGEIIPLGEELCIRCAMEDYAEEQYTEWEHEDYVMRKIDFDELQGVSVKLLNNGGEYIDDDTCVD